MAIEERIAKLGFKRWYERTLVESHAFLITALLGAILAFTGMELIGQNDGDAINLALGVVAMLIGGMVAAVSVHRYIRMLMLAINLGEHATCRDCNAYAKFDLLHSGRLRSHGTDELGSLWMRVKCRKCGFEWRIE